MKLLTNNPKKRTGLTGYGLEITATVDIEIECNIHNEKYLETKKEKMGHDLKIKKTINLLKKFKYVFFNSFIRIFKFRLFKFCSTNFFKKFDISL